MRVLIGLVIVAVWCDIATAQSGDWQEKDRREREAHNYKIEIKQMEELVAKLPAPLPGHDKATAHPPGWCASADKSDTRSPADALKWARMQLADLRYWREALLTAAQRLCSADPKEPVTQKAVQFLEQHWINYTGLPAKDVNEVISLRLAKDRFEAGKTKLCSAFEVDDEVRGPERKFNAAKRELFDCGKTDDIRSVGTAPMINLVAWLDASGSQPDEIVRLAYVSFEANVMTERDAPKERERTLPYYIVNQNDFKQFDPGKVLALLDKAPYKDNPYARVIVKEQVAATRPRLRTIDEDIQLKIKDADWKELLITAPQRGIDTYTQQATKFAAELKRSNEFEQKAFGPSRKALQGCRPTLKKDLETVLKTLKRTTGEELLQEINDNYLAGLLFMRYMVCAAAEASDATVAAGLRKFGPKVRVVRGPRVAAYFAALDALAKIRDDRPKFPVQAHEVPYDRTEHEFKLAGDLLDGKKTVGVGLTDERQGVIKTVKKDAKGVTVTFNPAKRQIYTESCTTTNRIVMFDHSGSPIYYRKCKGTGMKWIDESPNPIVVPLEFADGLKAGQMIKFAVVPYDKGERWALPQEVYADKTGKKVVGYYGLVL
jgi:hypothetical protein